MGDELVRSKTDYITSLLSFRDEEGKELREEEIIDHIIALMIASRDASAILLSLMVWKMGMDKE
ncbi:hypothetical protein AMTR_s00077p00080640, partial [Amborella trichopoda]